MWVVVCEKSGEKKRENLHSETDTVRQQDDRKRMKHLVRASEADVSATRLLELPCERSSEDEIRNLEKERYKELGSGVDASK